MSDNPDIHSKSKTSRRTYMKGAGAFFGFPALSLKTGKRKEKLVTAARWKNGEKEPVNKKKVPDAWNGHKKRVKKANSRVTERYLNKPGVQSVGSVRAEDQKKGGKHGFKIEVAVDKDSGDDDTDFDPEKDIPSQVMGITVEVVEAQEIVDCCTNIDDFSDMPGGVSMRKTSGGERGTAAWRVDIDGEKHMITAYHLVDESGDVIGDDVYGDEYKIGTVGAKEGNWDVAFITDSNVNYTDKIKGENQSYTIAGYATEDGVCERASDYFDGYTSIGTTSGKTTGGVKKCHYTYDGNTTLDGHGVKGGADQMVGDSGGPAFSVNSDGEAILIASMSKGINTKGTKDLDCGTYDEQNAQAGIAAYHLENNDYHHLVGDN